MRQVSLLIVVALFTSCTQKKQELTPAQIKAKTDSTVASMEAELKRVAAEDLDRRSAIEVKAITDSIVNAYVQKQVPPSPPLQPDTSTKAQAEP